MRISTAVVTGAASGIGLALSTRLSAGGAHVVMADVDREALAARAADLGATATPVVADLTDPVAVHALADTAFARLGHVDLLVNNAGVVGPVGVPVWEVDPEQVRRVLDVNFWSHLHVARAFVPRLLAQGRPAHIVQTASMSAFVVGARSAAYAASKHADLALARSLRADLAGTPVRVSALCPGRVDTPMTAGLVAPANATGATTVSADHVAGVVEAAVGTDRFYLFTNPDTPDRLADQFDDVWRHTGAGSPRPQEAPS